MNQFNQPVAKSKLLGLLPGVYYSLVLKTSGWSVVSVTDQTRTLFEYTPEEIYSHADTFLSMLIHPEDIRMVIDKKKAALLSASLCVDEYRIVTKTGNAKFIRDQYTCYEDENFGWVMEGYVNELPSTGIRNRLLQQLQAYRHAVDVNMISSITDRKGKIVYVNENFCRVSKYSKEELIGENHRIISSGHHPKEFFHQLWKTISSGSSWSGEIMNRAKDGSFYWVDTVIIPVFDESSVIINYLSLRILINDRKAAEEHRRNYIKLLERIASIVAHDVRGPICSILGLTDLATFYPLSASEQTQTIHYLRQSAEKLNQITQRLSQFVYENEIEWNEKLNESGEEG